MPPINDAELMEKIAKIATTQYMRDMANIRVGCWLADAALTNPVTGETTNVMVLVHATNGDPERAIVQEVLREYLVTLLSPTSPN